MYPDIDVTTLGNVFDVAGRNIELAKKVRTASISLLCFWTCHITISMVFSYQDHEKRKKTKSAVAMHRQGVSSDWGWVVTCRCWRTAVWPPLSR